MWKDGFGVMYSKSAALPIGLPASILKNIFMTTSGIFDYKNAEKYILSRCSCTANGES